MKASFTHIAQEIFRKKSIIVVVYHIIFSNLYAQTNVYDCNAFDPLVMPQDFQNNNAEYFKQCILFAPPHTYSFSGTSNKTIKAATEIHIKEGFHAGAYTGNGQSHLQIMPKSDFDVFVMNYNDLNAILKLKKFEIGIALPASILTKVNNFVNEDSTGEQLNPYLDWELRVYAEFRHASLSQPIVIDGFYTKEYDSWQLSAYPSPTNGDWYVDSEYQSLGGYVEDTTMSNIPFRVRFAPPKTGQWSCVIKIKASIGVNQFEEYASLPFQFKVVESGIPGYMKVGQNKRYLSYNDKTFFPIGCNIQFPETRAVEDSILHANLSGQYVTDWNVTPPYPTAYNSRIEGYRENKCIPQVYNSFLNRISSLANNGANYLRIIQYPGATDLEWEKLGNYTDNLHMAQEMDRIVDTAEANNVFLHWNFSIHYNWQPCDSAYYRLWTWDKKMFGYDYCYKQFGTAPSIGSPAEFQNEPNPIGFFTNETAQEYWKQRMRYIVSRYGYSTSIAVWELLSEIANIRPLNTGGNDFYKNSNNWMIYRDWQVEMGNYLKTLYYGKQHLVTCSYPNELNTLDNTYTNTCFDVMSINNYDFKEPDFGSFFIDNISKKLLNENISNLEGSMTFYNEKPLLFAEADPIEAICDENKLEMIRAMWQGMFSGLAGYLSWHFVLEPSMYPELQKMKDFISDIELDGERWHPGASILNDFADQRTWQFKENYSKNMDNSTSETQADKMMKADLSYLRSGDGNFAIGVLTNKTYNFASISDCENRIDGDDGQNWYPIGANLYENLETSQDVNCNNNPTNLKLKGLNTGRYYLDYFLPGNTVVMEQSNDLGPKVKIEYTIEHSHGKYIVPFKVNRKNHYWIEELQNETVIPNNFVASIEDSLIEQHQHEEVLIYPNPFQNTINVEIPRTMLSSEYEIVSTEGKMLKKGILNEIYSEIKTDFIEKGVYLLKIGDNNEEIYIYKILKL